MTVLLVVTGALLIVLALVDVAWTTVAAGSGAGPITSRASRRLWQVALFGYRRRRRHVVLVVAGVAIMFSLLAIWIVLVLTGWSLIFASSEGAVIETITGRPADLVARLYFTGFTGFTVFTLGIGDFRPGPGFWQLATVAATGTGLVLVSLSITYLVPVASAVAQRRQLASTIASYGGSPQAILTRAWTGEGFGSLGQHLGSLVPLIQGARQQHFTYPILHYFHSPDRASAAAPNLVNLDDALLLLAHGVAPAVRPDPASLLPLRETLGSFLDTLAEAYIDTDLDPHPAPSLEPLRAAGVPVVEEAAFREVLAQETRRRRLLRGLLADDGWS